MADIARNIVYLNREQFETLRTAGGITVGDTTIDYNDKDIYMVSDDGNVVDYNASLSYTKGDIVYYEGKIYTPTVESVIGVEPTNTENWKSLTANIDMVISNLQNTVETNSTNIVNLNEVKADKTEVVTLDTEQNITAKKIFDTVVEIKDNTLLQDVQYLSSAIAWKESDADWSNAHKIHFPTKSGTIATLEDVEENFPKVVRLL